MNIHLNFLRKINLELLSLEKLLELIHVNNEMPCLRFLLSSSGLIQMVTPNKLGVYSLAMGWLVTDRLMYLKETPTEVLVFLSGWNLDTRDYSDWRVRYEIESCRWKVLALFKNQLIIKGFSSFFTNLQILSHNITSYEDLISSRIVINYDCRDTELPANGDCDDGWYVLINSTHLLPDETASIECLECKI